MKKNIPYVAEAYPNFGILNGNIEINIKIGVFRSLITNTASDCRSDPDLGPFDFFFFSGVRLILLKKLNKLSKYGYFGSHYFENSVRFLILTRFSSQIRLFLLLRVKLILLKKIRQDIKIEVFQVPSWLWLSQQVFDPNPIWASNSTCSPSERPNGFYWEN